MIDIHTHILPGIDDGAQAIEESIEIAKRASDEGVKAIVATPHVIEAISEDGWKRIRDIFDRLKQRLISAKIGIDIILGAELFISPDVPAWIKRNRELTINGGNKYVLIELPLYEILFTEQTIFELLLQGVVPIIAHPERCMAIQQDTNRLSALIGKGALTQVNVGSLTGKYGKAARKTAEILLTRDLIHMIGTDVHTLSNGYYPLSQGMNMAAKVVGIERAKEMVTSIPERIIRGEDISTFCCITGKVNNESKNKEITRFASDKKKQT